MRKSELGESYEEVVAVIEGADRVREPLGRVRREVVDVLERAVVLEQPFDELVVLFSDIKFSRAPQG